MASVGYSRFGLSRLVLVGALAIAATATISTTDTYASESRRIYSGTTSGTVTQHSDGTVILEFTIESPAPHFFDLALPTAVDRRQRENGGCTPLHYRAKKNAERRCLSAVQPSSVAGWRSGRVKRLASGCQIT